MTSGLTRSILLPVLFLLFCGMGVIFLISQICTGKSLWLWTGLAGSAILLCGGVLTTLLIRTRIISRLHPLISAMPNVIGEDSRAGVPVQTHCNDEISQLCRQFNAMSERTHSAMEHLRQALDNSEKQQAAMRQQKQYMEEKLQHYQELQYDSEKAERLEMIGTAAGGAAHDLNNILAGVVSYPDLLLMKTEQDSPLYKPLKIIQDSGRRASAIVQDLLTLTRRGAVDKKEISLNTVVEQYLESPEFLSLMGEHKQTVVITEPAEDLYPIRGSNLHLSKTIMNLVSNAVEAMPRGGKVMISTDNWYKDTGMTTLYETVGEGIYVILQVSDQGKELAREELEKIFQPFFTTKTMGRGGTGLGMVIVRETVKDHDGHIFCESGIDRGTEFTIFFPALSSALLKAEVLEKPPLSIQGKGEKILVVDDVPEQRELATAILVKLGYQVSTAATGEQGIELIRQEQFDLLLLDMILGEGIDGLDTFRAIRKYNPAQKALITSGYSESERIKTALQLGAGRHIKKPYIIQELGYAVRQELERPGS